MFPLRAVCQDIPMIKFVMLVVGSNLKLSFSPQRSNGTGVLAALKKMNDFMPPGQSKERATP